VLCIDHITLAANSLAEGVAYAESALGFNILAGGTHPLMGTHNHLLRLGETLFFEVIAPDPAARPARPRWFSLDDAAARARLSMSPRLITWVVSTPDIDAALGQVPHAAGPAIVLTRGDLTWRISVPSDGSMPFDGAFPSLIQWPPGPHPASRMADLGCSLVALDIAHPQAETIQRSLQPFFDDPRVTFNDAPEPAMTAVISTPQGHRLIS
jgi:glyoxalase-like protein